jgi:hypothetical protein
LKALPPSDSAKSSAYIKSQAAYSICDGRYKAGSPRPTVAPPVQLFHPAFGHFLDDISEEDPIPNDIIRETIAYMKEPSAVYPTENNRRDKLTPLLSNVLDVFIQVVQNSDKTCPDGIVEYRTATGPAAIMHIEEKMRRETGVPTLLRKPASHIRVLGLS